MDYFSLQQYVRPNSYSKLIQNQIILSLPKWKKTIIQTNGNQEFHFTVPKFSQT